MKGYKMKLSETSKMILKALFGIYGQMVIETIQGKELNASENIFAMIQHLTDGITFPKFASFTYTDKKHGETARRVLQLGVPYSTLLNAAILEVELLDVNTFAAENKFPVELVTEAKNELLASWRESLEKNAIGQFNSAYTKAGIYSTVSPGIKVNENDGTLEIWGVEQSKVVLVKGIYPIVKSKPLTLAKNAIKKLTRLGKFKSLSLDAGHAHTFKLNGETIQFGD